MFLFPPDTSNHCLCVLNTAQPGESRAHARGESARGESESRASNEQASEGQMLALEQASEGQVLALEQASEGQVLALEQKKRKKFTWLIKLMRKFQRRQMA